MAAQAPLYDLMLLLSATAPEEQRTKILADVESTITKRRRARSSARTTGASVRSRTGSTISPTPTTTCCSSRRRRR